MKRERDICEICKCVVKKNKKGESTYFSHAKCNQWGVGVCLCQTCAEDTSLIRHEDTFLGYMMGFSVAQERAKGGNR